MIDQPGYLPLGTTAHKQGRVAGTNAAAATASSPAPSGRKWCRCSISPSPAPVSVTVRLARPGTTPSPSRWPSTTTSATTPGPPAAHPPHRRSRHRPPARRPDRRAPQRSDREEDRHLRDGAPRWSHHRRRQRPRPQLHPALRQPLGRRADRRAGMERVDGNSRPQRLNQASPAATRHSATNTPIDAAPLPRTPATAAPAHGANAIVAVTATAPAPRSATR